MAPSVTGKSNSDRVVSIPEAARLLRVSERTIYRMIKSGRLERVDGLSVAGSNEEMRPSQFGVRLPHSPSGKIDESQTPSDICRNMSDASVVDLIEALKSQVVERDRQIQELIERHGDLQDTLAKLQDQLFELARLVLSHNVSQSSDATAKSAEVSDAGNSSRALLSRLFRGAKRSSG